MSNEPDETTIAASIASRTASVSDRYPTLLLGDVGAVRLYIHETVDLRRIGHADADEPAVAVRVLVHGLRLVDRLLIHVEHLSGERRDDVRDRLHRLDLPVGLVLGEVRSCLGRLEVDELAERVLREPGDSEDGLVALAPGPVVLGVVLPVGGV